MHISILPKHFKHFKAFQVSQVSQIIGFSYLTMYQVKYTYHFPRKKWGNGLTTFQPLEVLGQSVLPVQRQNFFTTSSQFWPSFSHSTLWQVTKFWHDYNSRDLKDFCMHSGPFWSRPCIQIGMRSTGNQTTGCPSRNVGQKQSLSL